MIAVEEAQARVIAGVRPLPAETVSLSEALGRVLAEDVAARVSHPPTEVSAMDGYAVRAADVSGVPVELVVVGEAGAGRGWTGTLGQGQAVRIFTGAPVPAGADAVVIQENTDAGTGKVLVKEGVRAGTFVRPAGLDFSTGEVLLKAGEVMTARRVGLAAAMNVPWLRVVRRPRIAILSTGDEIVMPGDPVAPGQIVSSNGPGLAAFVAAMGGVPIHLGIALDTRESLASLAAGAKGADMLVTTGGASVGDYDLVKPVLAELGMELDFYKIAMRPGKPLMFGSVGDIAVLGLPGNPVSAMVCATVFLGPAIMRMLGRPTELATARAVLGTPVRENDRRQEYLRGRLERGADGTLVATPFDRQDSAVMSRLAQADCLIVRPPFAPAAQAGDAVTVVPLDGGI